MKRLYSLLFCLGIALSWAQSRQDILPAAAPPVILNNVSSEMRQPGYWISRHPRPDSLIMSPTAIGQFNQRIRSRHGTVTAIEQHSTTIAGRTIRNQINRLHNLVKGMRLYNSAGERPDNAYWAELATLENSSAINGNLRVRFALATSFAHQRLVPTLDNLNKEAGDIYFDEVQNSGYDIGTPIVLYHNSRDGNWAFGATAVSSGWFRLQDLGIISRQEWQNYQRPSSFVVVIADKADIWLNPEATRYQGMVRMGNRFELLGESGDYYKIKLLTRNSSGGGEWSDAYLAKTDCNVGYLPYTTRNVYMQAFKMLNHRYGWGDMNGDWDCSSMLIHIFASFGIRLPRNGASQAAAARVLHEFSSSENEASRNRNISQKALAGITFLQMRGHITLYLGEVAGRHYILHNTSGYRAPAPENRQYIYSIKATVISDLYLGEGSDRFSLLSRLLKISAVIGN